MYLYLIKIQFYSEYDTDRYVLIYCKSMFLWIFVIYGYLFTLLTAEVYGLLGCVLKTSEL